MNCVPFAGLPKASPLAQSRFLGFILPVQLFWAEVGHSLGLNNLFPKKALAGLCLDVISRPCSLALGHVSFAGTRSETCSHGGKCIPCPISMSAAQLKFLVAAVTSKVLMRSEFGENIQSLDKLQLLLGFFGSHPALGGSG